MPLPALFPMGNACIRFRIPRCLSDYRICHPVIIQTGGRYCAGVTGLVAILAGAIEHLIEKTSVGVSGNTDGRLVTGEHVAPGRREYGILVASFAVLVICHTMRRHRQPILIEIFFSDDGVGTSIVFIIKLSTQSLKFRTEAAALGPGTIGIGSMGLRGSFLNSLNPGIICRDR